MDSLYYASRGRDARALREEYELRKRYGLQVELLEHDEVQSRYGIDAPVAILSHQAARIDPYRMAYRLLARLQKRGSHIFDRTRIARIQATSRGVSIQTVEGQVIRADHLVLAAGYANQQWLKQKVAQNRSSYAFITDPIDTGTLGELKDTMVWESARPYLYMRSTGDGRLLVGGEDDSVDVPARRDARVDKKARVLEKKVNKLFPDIPFNPAFSWAGTFAETRDGLPFFGPHKEHGPRVHFAMAYGGNGITYSMLGAGLLRAQIERRAHPLKQLFGFARLD
jgi:glycine/D-amino acid oxidase-like deaminating enzyme